MSVSSPFPCWVHRPTTKGWVDYFRCRVDLMPQEGPSESSEALESRKRTYHEMINGKAKEIINGGRIEPLDPLKECACGPLHRKNNAARHYYENIVIKRIWKLAKSLPPDAYLDVSIFASGELLSELVLIIRLIDYLQEHGGPTKLRFNFIDTIYHRVHLCQRADEIPHLKDHKENLEKIKLIIDADDDETSQANQNSLRDAEEDFDRAKKIKHKLPSISGVLTMDERENRQAKNAGAAVYTFLKRIKENLPTGYQFKARFFSEISHYQALCETHSQFRNHMQIGTDIENGVNFIRKLALTTQHANGDGIVLLKNADNEGAFAIQADGFSKYYSYKVIDSQVVMSPFKSIANGLTLRSPEASPIKAKRAPLQETT